MKAGANNLLQAAAALAAAAFLLDWALSTLTPWLPLFAVAIAAVAIVRWRQR